MRYFKYVASFLVAVGILLGLPSSFVTPVAAQERTGVWEPDGLNTFCVNKGPLRMVKMTSVVQLEPFKCGDSGSYVAVQLYNYDAGQKNPTTKVEGLSWDDAKMMMKQPPSNLDSGSFWYEPQNPPAGAPRIITTSNVPSEPYGKGTFCGAKQPLTFNTIPDVNVLVPFKCPAPGTYSVFQIWKSGNENDVLFREDGLTFEQALGKLKAPPKNYDSGTLLFYPSGAQPAPTSTPAAQVATVVPTATLQSQPAATATPGAAPVIAATATPTRTPTDQPRSQGEFPWLPVVGVCLSLLILGAIAVWLLFLRKK